MKKTIRNHEPHELHEKTRSLLSFAVLAVLCFVLLCCSCQKEQAQAQPETVNTTEVDPIQDLLNQNQQLIDANQQLMAELSALKNAQAILPNPAQPAPSMFIPMQSLIDTEELWRQVLEIANKSMIDSADKQKFLQTSSDLIQKIAVATAVQHSAQEAIDALELSALDDPTGDATLRLANAKQQLAAAQAEAEQYQRDLLTVIEPYKQLQPPQLTQPYLPPANVMSYDGLSISPYAIVTNDGHFLITLSFVVSNTINAPRIANVTTQFDLITMQTILTTPTPPRITMNNDAVLDVLDVLQIPADEEWEDDDPAVLHYEFPANFISQIHKATKTAWRTGTLRWNRKLTADELLLFVQLVNRKDFTPITVNTEEEE